MSNEVLVGILSLVGVLVGSGGGVLVSARLTNFRLEQLEKKVEKHNNIVERMTLAEEKIKVANHRIEDLERVSL